MNDIDKYGKGLALNTGDLSVLSPYMGVIARVPLILGCTFATSFAYWKLLVGDTYQLGSAGTAISAVAGTAITYALGVELIYTLRKLIDTSTPPEDPDCEDIPEIEGTVVELYSNKTIDDIVLKEAA